MRVLATVTTRGSDHPPASWIYAGMASLMRDVRSADLIVRELEIADMRAGTVPPQVWDLTELTRLSLNGLSLHRLPSRIGRLKRLASLSLADNHLDSLPVEVFTLPLQRVILANNRLSALPAQITRLSDLRVLDVRQNVLQVLPLELGSLQRLESLHLDYNQLQDLPASIGELQRLTNLTASGNRLTTLPNSIGTLRTITNLDVSKNQLVNLPSAIGRLVYLQSLDLSHNELRTLPLELASLPLAVNLSIGDNPLAEILLVFANRGAKSLLTYLRTLADAKPQYEAKVLLVGEGNVGKTSLVAAIQGKPFEKDRLTTHGIDRETFSLPEPNLSVDITLNSWDFGGQPIYRVTHQFFFSPRALYLLVWRPREGEEENAIEAWCQRIRLRVGDDARVMIVATHRDERTPELDYPSLKRKFGDLLVGAYAVDNASGNGVKDLRGAIAREAAKLPQMGERMSPLWIAARDEILQMEDAHISYTEFVTICSHHGLAAVETTALANVMHDLGYVIHYSDDEGLRDIVVLQPEWLTKAMSYVLEDDETKNSAGVLLHRRLAEIWSDRKRDRTPYPRPLHPYFLRLMEKFDVSYRLPEQEDASLIGQLVPHERPSLAWENSEDAAPGRSLSMVCQLAESPPGLIAWLTVRNHRFSVGQHWRSGVFLAHPPYSSEALLELVDHHYLSLDVRAPSPDYFFSILRDSVEDLIAGRWPGLRYQLLVPCPGAGENGVRCGGLFKLRALERLRERGEYSITCQDCVERQDVLRLLTGFYLPPLPEAPELRAIRDELSNVSQTVDRIEERAAQMAGNMRALVKAASIEVSDCPRLVTIVKTSGVMRDRYRLTLWCEHPGTWHACQRYDTQPPRQWVVTVAPYALLVLRILRGIVPLGGVSEALSLSAEELSGFREELKLMSELLEEFPGDLEPPRLETDGRGALTLAEGAALRGLRSTLFAEDPRQSFGGLRRVFTSEGDFLWVCKEHYRNYDPGVPELPYDVSK